MKKRVIILMGIMIFSQIYGSPKLAVYGFNSSTLSKKEVKPYNNTLESALFDSKKFKIIDRSSLTQTFEEQKLDALGIVKDRETELGNSLGADYIVTGNLELSPVEYVVSIKVIDVKDSTVVFSDSESEKVLLGKKIFIYNVENNIRDIVARIDVDGETIQKNNTKDWNGVVGLSFPAIGWTIKNGSDEVTGTRGINLFLGYTEKRYFDSLEESTWKGFLNGGTVLVIFPYLGLGTDYIFDNGAFIGGSINGMYTYDSEPGPLILAEVGYLF